jgi:hypothetical protein
MHVDAVARTSEGELYAVVDKALPAGALAGAGLAEQRHRSLLQQAGADAAEHIVRGLPLQDDVVDAVPV